MCGETGVQLFTRERRSLDILSVKKEAKLSASELAEAKVGKGEEDVTDYWQFAKGAEDQQKVTKSAVNNIEYSIRYCLVPLSQDIGIQLNHFSE